MDIGAMIQEGLRLSNEWLRTHQAEIERIQREAFSGLHCVYEEVNVVEGSLIEPVTDPTRLLAGMSEQTSTTRTEPEEPFTVEAMEKAIQSLREEFSEQKEFWHSCHCPWFEPPFRLDLPIEQPSITAKWTAAGLYKEY